MLEEYETNLDGLVLQDGTWNYKIPTIDTIPKQFNVQILNSGHHQQRVLSSKGMNKEPRSYQKPVCSLVLFIYFPPEWTSLVHETGSFVHFLSLILIHYRFILTVQFQNLGIKTEIIC